MNIRTARMDDIKQIQFVRNAVLENRFSDPSLVTDKDCEAFLLERGKGWVCEMENEIVGFAIVDMQDNNVWALFLRPNLKDRASEENYTTPCCSGIFRKQKTKFGWEPHPTQELTSFTENPAGHRLVSTEKGDKI